MPVTVQTDVVVWQGNRKVGEKIPPSFPGFFQSQKLYFSVGYRNKK